MARTLRSDEGFSLLEVLFASFLAFFVLTAVFGLLVASTQQGRFANLDELAANLGQQVVEDARSLPYASVGTTNPPPGQPLGVLASSETTTFRGVGFLITSTVIWVNDLANDLNSGGDVTHDYKRLDVAVSWAGGHTTGLTTYIRDDSNGSPLPPLVAWVYPPPANAVLFTDGGTTKVWNGDHSSPTSATGAPTSLLASASVNATTGTIVRVEFWAGGTMMTTPPPWSGALATVSYPATGYPATGFPIDLKAVDASGNLLFNDGLRSIKVIAYNNALGWAYQQVNITVDNTAAAFSLGSKVALTQPTANQERYAGNLAVSWIDTANPTPPLDGNAACNLYDFKVESNGNAGFTWFYQDLGTSGTDALAASSPGTFTPTPFSAYKVTLTPRSIRGLTGARAAASAYTWNNPRLTGVVWNYALSGDPKEYRADLAPSAPATGALAAMGYADATVKYFLYSGTTYTGTDLTTYESSSTVTPISGIRYGTAASLTKYFQVQAVVSSGGSPVATLTSNVVGPPVTAPVPNHAASQPLTIP